MELTHAPEAHAQSTQFEQLSPTVGSHWLSPQVAEDVQLPLPSLQMLPAGQLPQGWPQPSSPHCLPSQLGTQHEPSMQAREPQPQSLAQLAQSSPAPQLPSPQKDCVTQWLSVHGPLGQEPQSLARPQPSLTIPQSAPSSAHDLGVQAPVSPQPESSEPSAPESAAAVPFRSSSEVSEQPGASSTQAASSTTALATARAFERTLSSTLPVYPLRCRADRARRSAAVAHRPSAAASPSRCRPRS